jgi:metal-sulfur cluster biosynthetic enzyme
MIIAQIEEMVRTLPDVKDVDVELTFDPMWSPDLMSEDVKAGLGLD